MSRERDGATPGTAAATTDGGFPPDVLTSRWLLVLAITALVAFGSQTEPRILHYSLLAAAIASNAALALLRRRLAGFNQALEVVTIADVIVVTLIIGWIDPSPQLYVAVFASLALAFALGRVVVIMLLMVLVCGVYAGYLYTEVGQGFWRQVELVLRVPFLYAVGLHFATVASLLKRERAETVILAQQARQQTERAEYLASEQGRFRALSEIGRLGLTGTNIDPVNVLLEMGQRARNALGATRCSLILFEPEGTATGWAGRTKDRKIEVHTLSLEPSALTAILPNGKMTALYPGESKDLMRLVKVFFPDSNPFGSLLVAPIKTDDEGFAGGLFLIDDDHQRKYNDGEHDFFWTVSLMTGAFIQARERLENEVRLRTLINAAPVIMFALGTDGTIQLFEGRGTAALGGDPAERVGRSIFEVAGNPEETRETFEEALGGRLAAGTLLIDEILFETQYSPLHGVDGEIAGVMGVTTAILDASTQAPKPIAASAPQPPPVKQPVSRAADPVRPAQPEPTTPDPAPAQREPTTPDPALVQPEPAAPDPAPEPAAPAERPSLPQAVDPYAAPEGLKPSIPLADEDPDTDTP